MKKNIYHIVALLLMIPMWIGCENRRENNGDLGGLWQMTQWKVNGSQEILKTKTDGLYLGVQRELLKFYTSSDNARYHLARFRHTADSLIIDQIFYYPGDTLCTTRELEKYGVPSDGKFHIDLLNEDDLILSTEEATLIFRKY